MRLVTYSHLNKDQIGLVKDKAIIDLHSAGRSLDLQMPSTMKEFLNLWEINLLNAKKIEKAFDEKKISSNFLIDEVKFLPPVPEPPSCRDGYAFRQHVATARRNRGVDMIPEFDQFPVFYFTNHNAIFGPGDVSVEEDHLLKLDFELECAVVICKRGKNIPAKEADSYIGGYMIMNDFSARQLQMEEMKLNLGPAKGKDFATAVGPYLVTADELEQYKIETEEGNKYDLKMSAYHNDKKISKGNLKDMDWTFAQIIERASYGVELFPGDIIGSGTVGTGCYLELNGTRSLEAKQKGEQFIPVWLEDEDKISLEIDGLGKLDNKIKKTKNKYSIVKLKKGISSA